MQYINAAYVQEYLFSGSWTHIHMRQTIKLMPFAYIKEQHRFEINKVMFARPSFTILLVLQISKT